MQVYQLFYWIKKLTKENENILLAGDFNATPKENCYKFLEENGFISSYKKVHGKEPEKTFPTGL